jgi:hypothetical protein
MQNYLNNIEIDFCFLSTILFLREEKEKCEAYDGYSSEEITNSYIQSKGFNPIEKYNYYLKLFRTKFDTYLTEKAYDLALSSSTFSISELEEFGKELNNTFASFPNKEQIINIYLSLYIKSRKINE